MEPPAPHRKLVVFIGGSSGIGFAALETLLATGNAYSIVLGSRAPLEPWRYGHIQPSLQSSHSTFDRIELNLLRYDSVKRFADTVKHKYVEPIDALVLCAGKMSGQHRETVDGEEETLQVNVLTHALLLDLLDPKLGSQSVPCRVLLVGSGLHRSVAEGTVDPGNLDTVLSTEFESMHVYQITKLIQVYLLYMAQERFEVEQRNVTVVLASPGFVPDSGLARELGHLKRGIARWILPHTPIATTMADAGRTVCRGVTQNYPTGTYFSERKIERTAEETYNLELREAWKQWFVAKGVWHGPIAGPSPAPDAAPGTTGAVAGAPLAPKTCDMKNIG